MKAERKCRGRAGRRLVSWLVLRFLFQQSGNWTENEYKIKSQMGAIENEKMENRQHPHLYKTNAKIKVEYTHTHTAYSKPTHWWSKEQESKQTDDHLDCVHNTDVPSWCLPLSYWIWHSSSLAQNFRQDICHACVCLPACLSAFICLQIELKRRKILTRKLLVCKRWKWMFLTHATKC